MEGKSIDLWNLKNIGNREYNQIKRKENSKQTKKKLIIIKLSEITDKNKAILEDRMQI